MKIPLTFTLLALAALSRPCSAQTVQTLPFAFTPDGTAVLTFNKFNPLGGSQELLSVVISVELNKLGGHTAVDNDSTSSGSITLTHTVTGQLSAVDNEVRLLDESFAQIGGSGTLTATSTLTSTVGPTTGDDPEAFNETLKGDYVSFDPEPTTRNASGTVNTLYLSDYIAGSDTTFDLQFSGNQGVSSDGVSGLQQVVTVSNVSGFVRVVYNYAAVPVPETSACALSALGFLGLLRRRR